MEEEMFNYINHELNDYDTLVLGAKIIEIAKNRLDSDLSNEKIKQEYLKLDNITKELYKIIENYV